jgi:hypothetical protein
VLTVRATKKLLRLTGPSTALADDGGTTLLGPWYATVLFWRPRVALLVNESTLLPVLLPLAPVSTLTSRLAEQIATVLTAHRVLDPLALDLLDPTELVDHPVCQMRTTRSAPRHRSRRSPGALAPYGRSPPTAGSSSHCTAARPPRTVPASSAG